ncbi:MAG: LPXTG cell wall anchor domain-containing protein [Protaetiibacter sp.]
MTRLAALALAVAVALGLAIAPTASASAAADFTATSDVAVYYAGSTADIYLVNTPPGAVTLSWEWRPEGDTVWHPLTGSADWIMFPVSAGSGGEYRGVATDGGGLTSYSAPYTLTVTRLEWSPTPMYLPEGSVLTQTADLVGADDSLIRWQIATSAFGPWTALPGAEGPTLSIPATLPLHDVLLRPSASVSGVELTGQFANVYVLPAEPALVDQADAEAVADEAALTLIQGAHLEGSTLVVDVPGGDPFDGSTWFHGTAYSSPTSLGWSLVSGGRLRFDVSSLAPGEHVLLVRLPRLGGTGLALSDAVRFTIPAAAPADDPQLAATGADADAAALAAGALGIGSLLLLMRSRRRATR